MRNTTEQIDLISSTDFLEDLLCFMSLFDGEDWVGFGGCDGERSGDGADFVFFGETWGVLDCGF